MTTAPAHEIPPGPKVLLYGDTGTGKTHAIRSLVDLGLEVFVLSTEPGIQAVLGDVPADRLHWHYLSAVPGTWNSFQRAAADFNQKTLKVMCDSVPDRSEFRQWMSLAATLANFTDDRTGKEFGDPLSWDSSRAFVIDSMSGINILAQNAWLGAKPAMGPPDYQVIQKHIADLFNRVCFGTKCWLVVTGHAEREEDELTRQVKITIASVGRKLAPQLPRFFDEMIFCRREIEVRAGKPEAKFVWSSLEPGATCKVRYLPWSQTLDPDFKALHAAWKAKAAI
jgi:hypothetical protein